MNFTRKAQFLSIFLFGIFTSLAAWAQPGKVETRRQLGCPNSDAGTFTISTTANSQPTSVQYLCYGDKLNILHNHDSRSFGDPRPLTRPGIGYAIYKCKPIIDGPDLTTLINNEPCLNKQASIFFNGSNVNIFQSMWLARDISILGDGFLDNTAGFYQNSFNNGNPVQLWFAAITLDTFNSNLNSPKFEAGQSGVPGPCIDVNIEDAFSVVFLNKIEISNRTGLNNGSGNYTGTLTITGGLPQFDGSNYPIVRIVHESDQNSIGILTNGPATHGKALTYTVPKPGKYIITVEDGTGCTEDKSTAYKVSIPGDPGLLKINCMSGNIGDLICIPISAGKMKEILAASFTFKFNPLAFDFVEARNLSNILGTDINSVIYTNQLSEGKINFFWLDLNLIPRDFTNESTLVELCFRAKGPPGNQEFRIGEGITTEFASLDITYEISTETGSQLQCTSSINPGSKLDPYFFQCGQSYFISVYGSQGSVSVKWEQEGNSNNFVIRGYPIGVERENLFSNQPPGRYFITVTDNATGSRVMDTITVDSSIMDLSLSLTALNTSCKNNDGWGIPIVTGGTPKYQFKWSQGSIDSVLTKANAGFHSLTVTDAQGCTVVDSLEIGQDIAAVRIQIINLPTCSGVSDGAVRAIIQDGKPGGLNPFEWIGTGIQFGNAFRQLSEGQVYTVKFTDAAGCTDTAVVTLTSQRQIVIDSITEPIYKDPSCFGDTDGRLTIKRMYSDGTSLQSDTVFVTNPLGIKSFRTQTEARFDVLGAGTYEVFIKDQNGCNLTTNYTLVQPAQLDTASVILTPESCFPGKDGRIEINMIGGTGSYHFDWSEPIIQDTGSLTGLSSGIYQVTVSDDNGCMTRFNNLSFPFILPTVPVSIDTTPILCNGQGATLTARPGAGYTISSYSWSDGQNSAIAQNIKADTLTWLEVTDDKGCKGRDSVILSQPERLRIDDTKTLLIDPQCPDRDIGVINYEAIGGVGPYSYILVGGPSNTIGRFINRPAGNFTIQVVDANQCSLQIDSLLREPPRIVAQLDPAGFSSTRCATPGDCSGQARLLVSGGTDPLNNFLVVWESGERTLGSVIAVADSLCSGLQTVKIFDGNGCNTKLDFTINAPEAISRDAVRTTTQDITCFGYNDGTIIYLALGGTSPFRYLWSDNDTTFNRTGLAAGMYHVTVTDLNNCVFTDSLNITQPPALLITLDTIRTRPITCPGSNDGQLGISASGGNTGKITYSWTANFGDTTFVRNVIPGTYGVVVTDVKGCTDTLANILVDEPPPLMVAINPSYSPKCAGTPLDITITGVSGGNGASYTYTINNGTVTPIATQASLRAGNYQLTIFDRKGCALDTVFRVTDPPRFNIELGDDTRIRLGDSFPVTVISNNPINRVQWVNIDGLTCVTGDCSVVLLSPKKKTVFSARAYDGNDCVAFDNITLDVDLKRAVFIPNIFRPDQLSANQEFKLFANAGIAVIHSGKIFNRWGDLVSDVQNLGPDPGGVVIWDGRFRGTEALPGVYVYVIDVEFTDGERLIYKGDVTLLR